MRGVFRFMAPWSDELYFYLQRRIGQQPENVGLRGLLQRHDIKDGNAQGTDILVDGLRMFNGKDVLL